MTVTDRPWPRAGGLGPDLQATVPIAQPRAAAGRNGVHFHHRRLQPDTGDGVVDVPFVFAVVEGDVGGRAAHVEADDPVDAGHGGGAGHADHAAGRSGENTVVAAEARGVGQSAAALHEEQLAPMGRADAVFDTVDVAA